MAYVFGFLSADGTLTKNKRGAHFLELQITDGLLLRNIRHTLGSNHKISIHSMPAPQNSIYRIQIGSKIMFHDLRALGLSQHKARTIKFPSVPIQYLPEFTRGYFDGDGYVWLGYVHKNRRTKTLALRVVFTSCSKVFLKGLQKVLDERLEISGSLTHYSQAYRLIYSTKPSLLLYRFMYNNPGIHLYRKKKIFDKYIKKGSVA